MPAAPACTARIAANQKNDEKKTPCNRTCHQQQRTFRLMKQFKIQNFPELLVPGQQKKILHANHISFCPVVQIELIESST